MWTRFVLTIIPSTSLVLRHGGGGGERAPFPLPLHLGYPSTYLALFPAYLSLHQFLTARSKQSKTGGGEGLGMRLQPILLLPVLVVHVISIPYSHTPILPYSHTGRVLLSGTQ